MRPFPSRSETVLSDVAGTDVRSERRGFLKDGQAVEFTQSYYRGDAYDFVAELNALAS